MMTAKRAAQIRRCLREWHRGIDRDLPWKKDKDPYKIWLSEIIMQQTRVDQGTPYYLRFVQAYPSIEELAAADIEEVLKLWQGLGYYRRARNMHAAALEITRVNKGCFPRSYAGLLALPGIGPYTARAIGSFAFALPLAVVDGNVIRVITRIQDIGAPIEQAATKKEIQALADLLLDKTNPGDHNQAMMDFGSTMCTPRKPNCSVCPLEKHCKAAKSGTVELIPVKKPRKTKQVRHLYYILINQEDNVYIRKRSEREIWPGLHEFFLIEKRESVPRAVIEESLPRQTRIISSEVMKKHELSHQTIICHFFEAEASAGLKIEGYVPVSRKNLPQLAVPRVLDWYLDRKALTLN